MPLQQTSGNVTADAYGGGAAAVPNYIEDVFSTWLYTGNDTSQTIINGIDLAGKGGITWVKARNTAVSHVLFDTARGASNFLFVNSTSAQFNGSPYGVSSFNSNGFTAAGVAGYGVNGAGTDYVSWTFRKQPKFFDVATFTTNSSGNGSFSHSLGSVPGCVIVKQTDNSTGWFVYHRDTGTAAYTRLSTTAAAFDPGASWINVSSTSVSFINGILSASGTYVAYLFAHNAGGFGATGTDNVISCGSFTLTGGTDIIDLGYEPQWLLTKKTNGTSNWQLTDSMRGMTVSNSAAYLYPNLSNAETSGGFGLVPTATGISIRAGSTGSPGDEFIYIAIRRGPMKVPTDATKVFAPVSATPSGATTVTTNFPVDLAINAQRDAGTSGNKVFWDRLRGSSTAAGQGLFSNLTNAEVSYSGNGVGLQSNTTIVDNFWNTLNGATTPVIYWNIRRAPSFFDEVCYTGTGSTTAYPHNLGVAPELMIVKSRNDVNDWAVYSSALGNTKYLFLNSTAASATTYPLWASTTPSATTFTTNGTYNFVGGSGVTYVAYLFATCAGVSKVFSFTGNGSTQTINCGFAGGARFVLLKASSATGGWYVYDTARGMTTLTDPYLQLNSTAAESATLGSVTTVTTGFAVNESVLAGVNTNGVSYIGLAIA